MIKSLKKIDLMYVFKNAPVLMIRDGINSIGVLALSLIAANYLTPEVFGTYKYILSLVGIAGVFSLTGAYEALLRQSAKDGGESMMFLCKKSFLWNMLTSFILSAAAAYYLFKGDTVLFTALIIPAAIFPIYKTALLYGAFLNGTQRFKEFAFFGSITTLFTTTIIGLAMYYINTPVALIIAFFGSNTVASTIVFSIIYKKHIKKLKHRDGSHTLRFSRHLSLINIIGQISLHIDNLITFQLLGPAQLAIYSFAKTPVEQIKAQLKVLANLIAPRFSTRSVSDIRSNIMIKALILFFIGAFISIIYIIVAPGLFSFLFPQYMEAVVYTQILSISLITLPNLVFAEALVAAKRTKELYIVRILTPVAKIIGLLILGYFMGLLGLILAILISRLLNLLLNTYFVWRL